MNRMARGGRRSSTTSGSHESDGVRWFRPGPGTCCIPTGSGAARPAPTPLASGPHLDPGTLDLWMTQGYQKAFRHLFDGTVEQYDPWDAAYRTTAPQYPGTTMCSAFRHLSGLDRHVRPALRPGVSCIRSPSPARMALPHAAPAAGRRPRRRHVRRRRRQPGVPRQRKSGTTRLLRTLTGIPDVHAGDSVWWHCDMIHSVAPRSKSAGLGKMSCTSRPHPWCPRNQQYAPSVREAFLAGSSPSGLPGGTLRGAPGADRFQVQDLNETGPTAGLGFS